MALIEEYKKKKKLAERAKHFYGLITKDKCDKFGATVDLSDTEYGFYGDRSVSYWPEYIVAGVEKIIKSRLKEMVGLYVRVAEREAESAREAAKNEAEEILNKIEKTK